MAKCATSLIAEAARWARFSPRLPHGYWVDNHLHRPLNAGLPEDKHELVDALRHQWAGVHGLQDIDAVFLEQRDVPVEDLVAFLGRHRFNAPGVGAARDRIETGEVDGGTVVETRLAAHPSCRVGGQLGVRPSGVEQNDVAVFKRHALRFGGRLDVVAGDEVARGHGVNAFVLGHADENAAADERRHDAMLQYGGGLRRATEQRPPRHIVAAEISQGGGRGLCAGGADARMAFGMLIPYCV